VDQVARYVYYLFALVAVASALVFVTRKSPVSAALWLVSTMFAIAGMYVLMDAQFVAAVQVLVYAGAIMVVFLFVVMLLNLGEGEAAVEFRRSRTRSRGRRASASCCWPSRSPCTAGASTACSCPPTGRWCRAPRPAR
jgi:hypothetical protein